MNKIQKEFSCNKNEKKGSMLSHIAAWFVCAVTQALAVLVKEKLQPYCETTL
jgi:hypothetical protein